jgi:hypothetical protein
MRQRKNVRFQVVSKVSLKFKPYHALTYKLFQHAFSRLPTIESVDWNASQEIGLVNK